MTAKEVVPAFLAVCPSIAQAWQTYLASWGSEQERGHFNDVAIIAHHLVDSFELGQLSEFPCVFALVERCIVEGDEEVRSLVVVGVIEDIQNISSHRSFEPSVFYDWLGPNSKVEWDKLRESWFRVEQAKAAGLLESTSPPIDPISVQDPSLRQFIESIYRK